MRAKSGDGAAGRGRFGTLAQAETAFRALEAQIAELWGPVAFDASNKRFESRTALAASVIEGAGTSVRAVVTDGYAAPGDGGGALYRFAQAEPEHQGKVQGADGNWWELARDAGPLNVRSLGATGDGKTDDTAAVQAAADLLPAGGGTIAFSPGTYLVSRVDLPLDREAALVGGPGVYIRTMSDRPAISRLPLDQSQAKAAQSRAVHVSGLTFLGDGSPGQVGLRLAATYGATVRDCHFAGLDTGLDLLFALMTRVEACRATNCRTDGFVARHGDWLGATTANAQSNHTTFTQCRNFARKGMNAAFRIWAASGVVLRDCITEGRDPIYNVEFDDLGSTVVKDFRVENLHSENTPSGAIFRCRQASGGITRIDGVYFQHTCTFLDASESHPGSAAFVIGNIPWWPEGSTLAGGNRYAFFGDIGGRDMTEPALWRGGAVPERLHHVRAGAGRGLEISYTGGLALNGTGQIRRVETAHVKLDPPQIPAGGVWRGIAGLPGFAGAGRPAVTATPGGGLEDGLSWCASGTGRDGEVEVRIVNHTDRAIEPASRWWAIVVTEI